MRRSTAARGGVRRGARRGATLVLTTVLLTVLLLMAAASIDLGRLFTLKNELQTAADAAALAGAKALLTEETTVQARASAVASENHAIAPVVKVESVGYGVWEGQTQTLVPVASPSSADAVVITVSGASSGLLSPLVQRLAPAVRATATAWATAPVTAITHCAKPWAMYYADLMQALGKAPTDQLTSADIRRMADTADFRVPVTLHFGGSNLGPGNYGSVVVPVGGAQGGAAYFSNIVGCNTVHAGDVLTVEPGGKVGPTVQGMAQLCAPLAADGTCYNASGGIGVPVTVAVYKALPGSGRSSITADLIGTVVIQRMASDATVTGFMYAVNQSGYVVATGGSPNIMAYRTILVQ